MPPMETIRVLVYGEIGKLIMHNAKLHKVCIILWRVCNWYFCFHYIVSAWNFESDNLYISYFLDIPQGKYKVWSNNSVVCYNKVIFCIDQGVWYTGWYPESGSMSGVTQVCSTKKEGRVSINNSTWWYNCVRYNMHMHTLYSVTILEIWTRQKILSFDIILIFQKQVAHFCFPVNFELLYKPDALSENKKGHYFP